MWLTDRYGTRLGGPVTVEGVSRLLDTIASPDGDAEHRTISLTDEDGWNLAFGRDRVLFENVEGDEVRSATLPDRSTALAIATEFIDGASAGLHGRPWGRLVLIAPAACHPAVVASAVPKQQRC